MKIIASICSVLLSTTALLCSSVHASSYEGEQFQYNPAQFQRVCSGKSMGQPAVVIIGPVIFNGTCENMLLPNSRQAWSQVEDHVLAQACEGKHGRISASLAGQETSGKCAKSFASIEPASAPATPAQ